MLYYEATAQLPHALTTTRIDYCNSLLCNLPKCSIARLQKIQNQAARILTWTPRCDYITEVLINLNWLKVEPRIIYKISILTYKSFVDLSALLYLRELVNKKYKSANIRLAYDSLLLVVPPISKGSSNTFLNDRLFMLHLLSGTNWMVVLEKLLILTHLNGKLNNLISYQVTLICNCTI